MDEFWAPYEPKIGDRVRLRLSRECVCYELNGYAHGHEGSVDEIDVGHEATRAQESHHVVVLFDAPLGRFTGAQVAPIECVPVKVEVPA